MRVMVVHHTPSLTQERYEAVVRGLTGGKERLESPADVPTAASWSTWPPRRTWRRVRPVRDVAAPIADAGIEQPPKSYPVHTYSAV